jgi:hypothetical protein
MNRKRTHPSRRQWLMGASGVISMGLFELFGMGAARADTPDARAPRLARAETFFAGPALELLQAALSHDGDRARELVAHGADPNSHGPASESKAVPQLTLLNYATGAQDPQAMALLVAVGADPLLKPREGDGDAFLFAIVRHDAAMLDALYRIYPLSRVPVQRQSDSAFAAVGFNANECLKVMFDHGLPLGIQDSLGDNLLVEALMRQDFDTVEWMIKQGVPVDSPPDHNGVTPANVVQRNLTEVMKPGSATWRRYDKIKQMMEQRGIVFPVETSAAWRARNKAR